MLRIASSQSSQHCLKRRPAASLVTGAALSRCDIVFDEQCRRHSSPSPSAGTTPSTRRSLSTTLLSSPSSSSPLLSHHHKCSSSQNSLPQIRTKVFVSRHNDLQIGSDAILALLSKNQVSTTKTSPTHVIVKECPFCTKPTKGLASNLYKLYISSTSGAYHCHRCGSSGSWYDLKQNLGSGVSVESTTSSSPQTLSSPNNQPVTPLPLPQPRLSSIYQSLLLDATNNSSDKDPVLHYLTHERGITKETLRKYGVGKAQYKFPTDSGTYQTTDCVSFPWMVTPQELQDQEAMRGVHSDSIKVNTDCEYITRRIKVRSLQNKAWQRLDPAGGGWGLFGWNTVPSSATSIVITEGEYDCMAVHQATGLPAVSLPNGCRSLPPQVLPLLERFEQIYLWMDNDGPGQQGAQAFSKKLGQPRTYIVNCPDAKDANEALLKHLNLQNYIDQAQLPQHDRILQFEDLRQSVVHELLHPNDYCGVPVPSLPGYTNLIKGLRRGEVTVLTGPTGSGKTTFLGQVSTDLAEQGIPTLWGSFEIKNTRLVHKLLQQYSRGQLPIQDETALSALCDRFDTLPLYFLKFHGGSDLDDVLDAMEYAVYVNDVQHIILDNLQFMISRKSTHSKGMDKFDVQDLAMERFRQFATDLNVHLQLVVHPRKEEEASKLSMSSIYGSAKATQEADTVVILQSDGRRKYLEVKKNRYDGTLGYTPLHFDRNSGRYTQDETGGAALDKKDADMPDLLRQKNSRSFQARSQERTPQQEVDPEFWNQCLNGT